MACAVLTPSQQLDVTGWHAAHFFYGYVPSALHTSHRSDDAQVTLSIEGPDGKLTPSGWSTRKEGGGDGRPFSFTPGQNLIVGWSEGVLKMREGERALLHVPAAKGYGASPQGSKGAGWYIPANSNRESPCAVMRCDDSHLEASARRVPVLHPILPRLLH